MNKNWKLSFEWDEHIGERITEKQKYGYVIVLLKSIKSTLYHAVLQNSEPSPPWNSHPASSEEFSPPILSGKENQTPKKARHIYSQTPKNKFKKTSGEVAYLRSISSQKSKRARGVRIDSDDASVARVAVSRLCSTSKRGERQGAQPILLELNGRKKDT